MTLTIINLVRYNESFQWTVMMTVKCILGYCTRKLVKHINAESTLRHHAILLQLTEYSRNFQNIWHLCPYIAHILISLDAYVLHILAQNV